MLPKLVAVSAADQQDAEYQMCWCQRLASRSFCRGVCCDVRCQDFALQRYTVEIEKEEKKKDPLSVLLVTEY